MAYGLWLMAYGLWPELDTSKLQAPSSKLLVKNLYVVAIFTQVQHSLKIVLRRIPQG